MVQNSIIIFETRKIPGQRIFCCPGIRLRMRITSSASAAGPAEMSSTSPHDCSASVPRMPQKDLPLILASRQKQSRFFIRQNPSRLEELRCRRALTAYLHLLKKWKTQYAPKTPEDSLDDRFVESCQQYDRIAGLLEMLDGRVTDDLPLRGEIYESLKSCAVNNIPRRSATFWRC